MERRHQETVEATWALWPEIASSVSEVEAAQSVVDELVERAKKERSKDRSLTTRTDTTVEIKEAKATLRAARATRREVKARLYPQAKAAFTVVRQARDAARKALYADWVQDRGLYWATYNDIVAAHETAVRRVAEIRKQGQPAELRFKRWDGTGTLTVQLQREANKPARTWSLLTSGGGPWRNSLSFTPGEKDRWWTMRASLGAKRYMELPVTVHRFPHDEADITLARITRRRIAGNYRTHVTLTARIPAPEPQSGQLIAVHLGWRSLGDDGLRVAVVASDRPLSVPRVGLPIRQIAASEGIWEVRLPDKDRHAHQRTDKLRSTRDQALDLLRADLAAWLTDNPQELTAADVVRWRSPARFAALAVAWRDDPPAGGEAIAVRLETWRRQDRHVWEWEMNERDQTSARVRDLWRTVAAWIADQAGMVVVDDINLKTITHVPPVDESDDHQAVAARRQRQTAAPGELRAAIRAAASARGVAVEAVTPTGLSAVHSTCGGPLTGDPVEQITLWCSTCGCGVDQDVNAAQHLIRVASASVEGLDLEGARNRSDQR
jgi:hypothetical protein